MLESYPANLSSFARHPSLVILSAGARVSGQIKIFIVPTGRSSFRASVSESRNRDPTGRGAGPSVGTTAIPRLRA
jgi:hypothetical protein